MKTYTSKNLEELLKEAAADKGVHVEDLTYTILEETNGFLGLGSKVTATVYCNLDIKEFMKEYLMKYFTGIDMHADINVAEDDGFFHVTINADNNAILIGKNGQTLQSMNNVLKSAASSEFKRRVGVLIDINKEEKYEKVCNLAMRVAKTVVRTKTDATLDPMPADERKAIHNCLTNVKNVTTVSEGEGSQRKLKICYTPDK